MESQYQSRRDIGRITKSLLSYPTAITVTKLSIMATYIRIFPTSFIKYTVYAIGVVVMAFWISFIFAIIITCVLVEAAWEYTITTSRCIDILDYFYTSAGCNIVTDFLVCFLPLPTIRRLKMPKAQRVVVLYSYYLAWELCTHILLKFSTS